MRQGRRARPRIWAVVAILAILGALGVLWVGTGCSPRPLHRSSTAAEGEAEGTGESRPAVRPASVAQKLQTAANSWLGTPYRYGGRTQAGIDCSALACRLLQEVGVSLPRTVRDQRRVGRQVDRSRPAPGDLLFFRLGSSGVNHVGVALGDGRFAHASRSRGVVVEDLETAYYAQRLTEARRVLD